MTEVMLSARSPPSPWSKFSKCEDQDENEDSGFGDMDALSPPSSSKTESSESSCWDCPPPPPFDWGLSMSVAEEPSHDDLDDSEQKMRSLCISDAVEPEDSVQSMITGDDFYKFVLFKTHYKRFTNLSQLYNEALETTCYLQEKYKELQISHAKLSDTLRSTTERLRARELELSRRDDELFDAMERLARMEDEGDKLKKDKRVAERKSELLESQKVTYENQTLSLKIERDHYASNCDTLKRMMKSANVKYDTLTRKSRYVEDEAQLAARKVAEMEYSLSQLAVVSTWLRRGVQHMAMCRKKRCRVCGRLQKNFATFSREDRSRKSFVRRALSGVREDLEKVRLWLRPVPLVVTSDGESPRPSTIRRPSLSLAVSLHPVDTPTSSNEQESQQPNPHDSGYYSHNERSSCSSDERGPRRSVSRGTNTLERRRTEESDESSVEVDTPSPEMKRKDSWRASMRKLFHRVSKR